MAGSSSNAIVYRIGFWSAIAATLADLFFALSAVILALVSPPTGSWTSVEVFAASFTNTSLLPFIGGFLIAPSFVVLMSSIHYHAPVEKRILTIVALSFSLIYAVLATTTYFTQVTTVRQNVITGNTGGLEMFIFSRPNSLIFNIDMLGYFMMSVAMLFAAPIFTEGKLETWIRWFFVVTGVLGLATVPMVLPPNAVGNVWNLVGLGLWSLLFPVLTILLAIMFKHEAKLRSK